MILEALGAVLLGLGASWAALQRLPHRLPSRRLVLAAGSLGSLFGAMLTHAALGPGHVVATLIGAVAVGVVLLSLLLRPSSAVLRRPMPS
ncbi:hypothetical protein GCM10011583_69070 [Streptomyces camponoticapitis]|uniref:Integral membrane protein n=1 Tax=Streptomyces camponoticapitis TaxID=1616125 RepID=A0ABQ2EVA2_9ACTN|nr:hypothetical protein [Streptomyces camponoticapitis]GGK27225.1 hypothetical protein GCM10011583_69070 [Streptomyces camponoticapitis]